MTALAHVLALADGRLGVELAVRLGHPEAWAHLLRLHAWAAVHRPDGSLLGLDPPAVARLAHWPGDPAALLAALEETGALVDYRLAPLAVPRPSAVRMRRLRARRDGRSVTSVTRLDRCANELCGRPVTLLAGEKSRLCVTCDTAAPPPPALTREELRTRIYAYIAAHPGGVHLADIGRHCAGQGVENVRTAVEYLQATHRLVKPRPDWFAVNPAKRRA